MVLSTLLKQDSRPRFSLPVTCEGVIQFSSLMPWSRRAGKGKRAVVMGEGLPSFTTNPMRFAVGTVPDVAPNPRSSFRLL